MTIQLFIDGVEVPVKKIKFSDGGSNVKLEVPEGLSPRRYICITVDPITPADNYLWEIGLVMYALEVLFPDYETKTIINLPYLPHGRADRVFERGNPCPLECFFDEFLCWELDNIEIHLTDPHSDFYKNYADNLAFEVKEQYQCFRDTVFGFQSGDYLISPDKGAKTKIHQLQQYLDSRWVASFVVEAEKVRDPSNGKILETTLPEGIDLTNKVCYIVDDICDGGGTFIPLAEKLKEAGAKEVHLYVTHGIFAKGLDLFKGKIDKLHVYQIVSNYVTMIDIMNFNQGKEVK